MATERIQRQIDRLLDDAEAAVNVSHWAAAAEKARAVIAMDAENADALAFLKMAEANRAGGPDNSGTAPGEPGAPAVPPVAPLVLPAAFAGGRYAVSGFLGKGGSKKVYLAHDTRLDRNVALAVVEGLDGDALERVRREARIRRPHRRPPEHRLRVRHWRRRRCPLYGLPIHGRGLARRPHRRRPDHRLAIKEAVRYAAQNGERARLLGDAHAAGFGEAVEVALKGLAGTHRVYAVERV